MKIHLLNAYTMLKWIKYGLLTILLHLALLAQAQLTLRHTQQPTPSTQTLFQITITNTTPQSLTIYLRTQLTEEKRGKLYEARSKTFTVQAGMKVITPSIVQPLQITENRLNARGELPPGNYTLSTQAIDQATGKILGEISSRRPVTSSRSDRSAQPRPSPKPVSFQGQGRITTQVAHRSGDVPQGLESSYLRTELYPKLSVWELPFGASVLLSTQQNSSRQSLNQFNLHFDVQQYQQVLTRKLLEKIVEIRKKNTPEELQELENLAENLRQQNYPDLDKLRETKDSNLLAQTQELEQLTSIQQILKNPIFEEKTKELASLQAQYAQEGIDLDQLSPEDLARLEQLQAYKEEYEKLQQKEQQLKAMSKQLKKYQAQQKKLEQIENADFPSLLQDPSNIQTALRMLGIDDKASQLLGNLRHLSVGTSYPYHSDLTLNGVAVTGGQLEYDSRWFYLAAVGGKTARMTNDSSYGYQQHTFARRLYAIRAGIGSKEGSHLHFGYLSSTDRGEGQFLADSSLALPAANQVASVEIRLRTWQKRLTVVGEIALSMHNRYKDAPKQPDSLSSSDSPLHIPLFAGSRNATSNEDFAYTLRAKVELTENTELLGFMSKVGATYQSFGTPVLLGDRLRYEANVKQFILEKKGSLSAFYRQDYDNLLGQKPNRSTLRSYGFTGSLQLPKYPFVQVTVAPFQQRNDASEPSQQFRNNSYMLNAVVGHHYGKKTQLLSQVSYLHQQSHSNISSTAYQVHLLSLTQTVTLPKSISLSTSAAWQTQQSAEEHSTIFSLDASCTAVLFKKWSNTLGGQWRKVGGTLNASTFDYSFYWQTQYPIFDWLGAELWVGEQRFGQGAENSFREFLLRGGLVFQL